MRRVLAGSLGMALALYLTGAARADDKGDAGAIIDKAISALGGEAIASKKGMTSKAKGTFYGLGDGIPYTSETAIQLPDCQRSNIEAEVNGQKLSFITVINGGKAWRKMNGDGMALDGDALEEAKEDVYAALVSTILPLKNKSFKITSLGDSKVDGHAVTGIKVAHKGHRDISLFFDKNTGLLAKTERRIKDVQGGGDEMNQETLFSDYKEVDGSKLAAKVTIKREGKKYIEQENSDMKLSDKLDPKLFTEP
jgi:hypothetical protein